VSNSHILSVVIIIVIIIYTNYEYSKGHSFALVETAQSTHITVPHGMWDCEANLNKTGNVHVT